MFQIVKNPTKNIFTQKRQVSPTESSPKSSLKSPCHNPPKGSKCTRMFGVLTVIRKRYTFNEEIFEQKIFFIQLSTIFVLINFLVSIRGTEIMTKVDSFCIKIIYLQYKVTYEYKSIGFCCYIFKNFMFPEQTYPKFYSLKYLSLPAPPL